MGGKRRMINHELALIYIAIGAVAELLTDRPATEGQKWGFILLLLGSGLTIGFLVPVSQNAMVIPVLFIAKFGRVLGKVIGFIIDKRRVKKWVDHYHRLDTCSPHPWG